MCTCGAVLVVTVSPFVYQLPVFTLFCLHGFAVVRAICSHLLPQYSLKVTQYSLVLVHTRNMDIYAGVLVCESVWGMRMYKVREPKYWTLAQQGPNIFCNF